MKSNKQTTFEEWMDEIVICPDFLTKEMRRRLMSITRYNFAKEVWTAAGGKFKSDEVSDEG